MPKIDRNRVIREIFNDLEKLPDSEFDRFKRNLSKLAKDLKERGVPARAPELYADRPDKSEHILDFIRRVYKSSGFLNGRFNVADVWRLDEKAGIALRDYMRGGKRLPPDINLPGSYRKRQADFDF